MNVELRGPYIIWPIKGYAWNTIEGDGDIWILKENWFFSLWELYGVLSYKIPNLILSGYLVTTNLNDLSLTFSSFLSLSFPKLNIRIS